MTHLYSTALRRVSKALLEHQRGVELLAVLVRHEQESSMGEEPDGFDTADALHWYCSWYYDGQWCPLYAVQCLLEYTPSSLAYGPESESAFLYGELVLAGGSN